MKVKKAEKALRQIAEKEGVSVEEVRREIEIAINAARENPDANIQAFWKHIPRKGEWPTPEEVIVHIASMFNEKNIKH